MALEAPQTGSTAGSSLQSLSINGNESFPPRLSWQFRRSDLSPRFRPLHDGSLSDQSYEYAQKKDD